MLQVTSMSSIYFFARMHLTVFHPSQPPSGATKLRWPIEYFGPTPRGVQFAVLPLFLVCWSPLDRKSWPP